MFSTVNFRRIITLPEPAPTALLSVRRCVRLLALLALGFSGVGATQAQVATHRSYEVLSVTPEEVTVKIAPTYTIREIFDAATGHTYSAVTFADGVITNAPGMRDEERLILPLLTPSRTPVSVEVISQSFEAIPNIDLAPVPTYTRKGNEWVASYPLTSFAEDHNSPIMIEPANLFRTAYTQRVVIAPVIYNAGTHSVSRITEMTLRIRFQDAELALRSQHEAVSTTEQDLFAASFLNGKTFQFYRSATHEIASAMPPRYGLKATSNSVGGQWLQVETNDEGIYHVTSQDLANAGISGAIDPNTIELFGVGGEMLDEHVTGTNGEWLEHPIEVRTNGSSLSEIVFYARGVTTWKVGGGSFSVDPLYHKLNPYTSSGHFLLKVGGERLGEGLRVRVAQDTILSSVVSKPRVFTSVVHEVERIMEQPNLGREMLGENIPRAEAGPLALQIDAPGYTGDSSTIRIGYDSQVPDGYTGFVSLTVGDAKLGTIAARNTNDNVVVTRSWDNAFRVPSSIQSPIPVKLDFSSNNSTSRAWLDWIEFMYLRTTNVGNSSIPFMVFGTTEALGYSFTNASGGEVWDVTNSNDPRLLSSANGDRVDVTIQGKSSGMRRFMAFSDQSLLTPRLTSIATPSLRSTIGQQGAQHIIIAPQALLAEAQTYQKLRQQGGEATEPLNSQVVTIEDIYREFGYGSRDIAAIRDFLSYTYRHTIVNGTTVPMYVVFFGGGHSDYQNRVTSVPNFIPAWEAPESEYLGTYRTLVYGADSQHPDDGFYARLIPHAADRQLDIATGRISAQNAADAQGFVDKVRRYEHASARGDWRGRTAFIADDHLGDAALGADGIPHFADTEGEVAKLQDRLITDKIYEVSYPTIYTSQGRRKPLVEQAILDAFNEGSVLISFVGHGNPHVWTHESVLQVPSTINKFTNLDRLPFLTTATCDFSEFDNFDDVSGGTMMLLKPDGGAIGLLGTSRSVTGSENLVWVFYQTLFSVNPRDAVGTASVGTAFLAGKLACYSSNLPHYYILGDPAQRLLVPKLYVNFDSINGEAVASSTTQLPALKQVRVSGRIAQGDDSEAPVVSGFNGTVTVTLYDAPTHVSSTQTIPPDYTLPPDKYLVEGPVLYRGTASVANGRFTIAFMVPKDIKFDSANAKLIGIAYADDNRAALGVLKTLTLTGNDSLLTVIDTAGPALKVFLGSRAFQSGDAVSMHSTIIVDVKDDHGLNTSTSGIGHGFVAWVDDNTDVTTDLAETFVSEQNDYTRGTSQRGMDLPAGRHVLNVRAFDTYDNPTFARVEFVAKKDAPYQLYNVSNVPNPVSDHTTFSFTQPGSANSLVRATLRVYSIDGRLVRTLETESRQSVIEVFWDGRDGDGARVANGGYIYHIDAQNVDDGTSSQAEGVCIVAH